MRTRDRSTTSLFRYSPLVAALACALAANDASAVTYTVNNTTDVNSATAPCTVSSCSLRAAVETAVANCNADANPVINFNIPGTGPFVISTATPLNLSCSAFTPANFLIDGSTQPGYAPNTDPNGFNAAVQVVLDGTANFSGDGIRLDAFPYGNTLTVIGLEVRNFQYGAGISGNMRLRGSHIHSNNFGLDPHGYDISNKAAVGGSGIANRNVIRNNTTSGIDIGYGGYVDIVNNMIGYNAAGNGASPNGEGITLEQVNDVTIQGNYIGGNSTRGIAVTNNFSGSLSITQNKIGALPSGALLGNTTQGIRVENSTTVPILNNLIANSGGNGIQFVDGTSQGVLISQNAIFGNGAKNIDLFSPGTPRPNDTQDPDTGPNGGQNSPTITSVTQGGGNTSVAWSLNTNPSTSFRLEFFSNTAPGTPAGASYIATSANQTTDSAGNASGVQSIPGTFDNVAATAINIVTNDTSEFSAAVALTPTPAVTISPNPLNFASTVVGASSGPAAITISSTGTANYVVSSFSADNTCYGGPICASGPFTCSNTCSVGTPYASGNSCAINVTFTPSATGPASGSFYICDNAPGSPRLVSLSGSGAAPPPATIAPSTFNFGSTQVGGLSSFQTFTLTNGGPTSIAIGPFTTTGQFQVVAGSCGATLGPSSSCTLDGRFAPTAPGPATGTIDAVAGSGSVSASVSGTGVAPPPTTITPVSFDFGSRQVGTTSTNFSFTISNPSLVPVSLTAVTTTGPFALVSSSCGTTLAPSSSCAASANFTPTVVGPATGSIGTVANGSNVSASLTGTGTPIPPPPSVTVTPLSTNFGSVTDGTTSNPVAFTITNPSPSTTANVTPLTTTGPFAITSTTCVDPLAAASSCSASVVFQPAGPGAATGTLVVPASTGTVTANLSGTSVAAQKLAISPPAFDFGPIQVGTSSNVRTFTVSNPNTVSVPITSLATVGPFSITVTSCGQTIAPSGVCQANVRFTPVANGLVPGKLVADTTGAAPAGFGSKSTSAFGTSVADLSGTGLLQSSLDLPNSIDMGTGTLGGAPIQRIVPVSNSGNAALTIESITIALPFTLTHDCPLNLLPGNTCNVNLELIPASIGSFTSPLVVFSNSAGGVRSIPVRASVQARPEPVIKLSPQSIGFGDRMAGTQSDVQRITVSNEGGGDAVGVATGVNTPHFRVLNTSCGPTLAAQTTCFADVVFAPLGFGPRRDTFSVRASNVQAPATVSMSGAGCRPITVTASRGGQQLSCAP